MIFRKVHIIETRGRGSYNLTHELQRAVRDSGVSLGLCNVFIHHTSASLMACENADPDVRSDFERFLSDLVPDGDHRFAHAAEGPDDMAAHIRSLLTNVSLTVPIVDHRCDLGTWQGVYLYEHRMGAQTRRITITIYA